MSSMRWTNEWINSDGVHKEYLFDGKNTDYKLYSLFKFN